MARFLQPYFLCSVGCLSVPFGEVLPEHGDKGGCRLLQVPVPGTAEGELRREAKKQDRKAEKRILRLLPRDFLRIQIPDKIVLRGEKHPDSVPAEVGVALAVLRGEGDLWLKARGLEAGLAVAGDAAVLIQLQDEGEILQEGEIPRVLQKIPPAVPVVPIGREGQALAQAGAEGCNVEGDKGLDVPGERIVAQIEIHLLDAASDLCVGAAHDIDSNIGTDSVKAGEELREKGRIGIGGNAQGEGLFRLFCDRLQVGQHGVIILQQDPRILVQHLPCRSQPKRHLPIEQRRSRFLLELFELPAQ